MLDIQFHRMNHVLRTQNLINFLFRQNTVIQYQLINTLSRFKRFLGYLGGVLVTDHRIQSRHYSDAVMHFVDTMLFIGRDASTQSVRNVRKPFIISSADSKQHCTITGSITFSSI